MCKALYKNLTLLLLSSTSHIQQRRPSVPYVSSKQRIIEKKYASVNRANSGWEIPGTTLATTADKGGRRLAHDATKVSIIELCWIECHCHTVVLYRELYRRNMRPSIEPTAAGKYLGQPWPPLLIREAEDWHMNLQRLVL